MVVRLILILLLAAFAMPVAASGSSTAVMAACHDMPSAPTHHDRDKAVVAHVCIGCVPVGDWSGATVAEAVVPAAPAPLARVATLDIGRTVAPARRPPRIA